MTTIIKEQDNVVTSDNNHTITIETTHHFINKIPINPIGPYSIFDETTRSIQEENQGEQKKQEKPSLLDKLMTNTKYARSIQECLLYNYVMDHLEHHTDQLIHASEIGTDHYDLPCIQRNLSKEVLKAVVDKLNLEKFMGLHYSYQTLPRHNDVTAIDNKIRASWSVEIK